MAIEECPQFCDGSLPTECGFCGFVVGANRISPRAVKKVKKSVEVMARLMELEDFIGGPVATRNQIIINLFTTQTLPNRSPAVMAAFEGTRFSATL
ncbi:MAG: hypothetical protein P8R43_06885 [Planctomycetota bacterium]|nr:hypothetical protein [Planctomycetota bacterium]